MKKKNEINKISASEAPLLYEGYKEQLETNPQYSLEVDPLDKYKFSAEQKKFIEYYIQLKNIQSFFYLQPFLYQRHAHEV